MGFGLGGFDRLHGPSDLWSLLGVPKMLPDIREVGRDVVADWVSILVALVMTVTTWRAVATISR